MRLLFGVLLWCGCGGGEFVVVTVGAIPAGATKIVARSMLDGRAAQSPEMFERSFGDVTSFALQFPDHLKGRLAVGVEAWIGDCVAAYESGEVELAARADLAMTLGAISPCAANFDRSPDMVWVPAGAFVMGCNSSLNVDCFLDEGPPGTVTLDAFQIDRTEVTVAAVQGRDAADPSLPVIVTWDDAKGFCEAHGKRLPTEAEWEKAARGTDQRRYPWGSAEIDCQHANFLGCPNNRIEPVGSRPFGASPYGALDMAGNLKEWVSDWYRSGYPSGARSNPTGPATGSDKVLRGGSYLSGKSFISTTVRDSLSPSQTLFSGVRCAR